MRRLTALLSLLRCLLSNSEQRLLFLHQFFKLIGIYLNQQLTKERRQDST